MKVSAIYYTNPRQGYKCELNSNMNYFSHPFGMLGKMNLGKAESKNFNFIAKKQTDIFLKSPSLSFKGETLASLIKPNSNYKNFSFAQDVLTNVNANYSDFTNASLKKSSITHSTFYSSNFEGADFEDSDISVNDFSSIKCNSSTNFSKANLRNSILEGAKLNGANFTKANLIGTNFTRTDLDSTLLSGAIYNDTTEFPKDFNPSKHNMIRLLDYDNTGYIHPTTKEKLNFVAVNKDYSETKLRYQDFSDVYIKNSDFKRTDLKLTNFRNSVVENSSFKRSYLKDADFSNAYIFSSDENNPTTFKEVNLVNANFTEAKFKNVVFKRINLNDANFNNAVFENCKFIDCDLSNINGQNLKFMKCKCNKDTNLYSEIKYDSEKMVINL